MFCPKKGSRLVSVSLVSCAAVFCLGAKFYVDDDTCPSTGSGTQQDPFCKIQDGIEATLQNGDEVIVMDGSYIGSGNRDLYFKRFGVGMPRLITVRSENGPANCTINGQDVGRGFNFDHTLVDAIDRNAVVDGFTITRGKATTLGAGGGILISLTSPIIRNCVIKDSGEGALFGGGICIIKDGNPLIENCVIEGNEASEDGGGIYLGPAFDPQVNAVITDCTIRSNTARRGGGIYILGPSDAHIKRCTIMNNTASNREGGGITLDFKGDVWIVNCFVAGNVGGGLGGGGIAMLGPTGQGSVPLEPHLVNVILSGNTASDGGGLRMVGGVRATIANTTISQNSTPAITWRNIRSQDPDFTLFSNGIIWANGTGGSQVSIDVPERLTVGYSDVEGGWTGDGNIDEDPLFLDPADDDFRLRDGSPCIDAASNLLVPNDETDLNEDTDTGERTPLELNLATRFRNDPATQDLFARFVDDPATDPDPGVPDPPLYPDVVDMGAYEFDDCSSNADCGDDGDPCNGTETCISGNCELVFTDCNKNGIDDLCDIADGTSKDCNANMIPDECEVGAPFLAELVASKPAHEKSLWRSGNNIVRLTFACDISAPGAGDVLVRKMLEPPELFGSDLSSNFTFTVEDNGGGPRILKIDGESSSTLEHREWYSFQNVGDWSGVANFEVQYVVQVGDANDDVRVLFDDLSFINGSIPDFDADDDAREDINGDGRILFDDLGVANASIPSFPVAKPSGH